MGAGLLVVFTGGVAWMAWGAVPLRLTRALAVGFYPFLLADLLKVLLAASNPARGLALLLAGQEVVGGETCTM